MGTISRAALCAVGLGALIALAGCGDDDDQSKSGAGKTTGTTGPARGFEKGKDPATARRTKRFATNIVYVDGCTDFIFQENHKCTGGTFQDVGNPTSPFASPDDGEGSLVWKEGGGGAGVKLDVIAVDPDTGPYATISGTLPPRAVKDKTLKVTGGKIPNWRATNLRSGTDPDKVGEQGGPLKVTVTSGPTEDVLYTVDIRGWLTYDVTSTENRGGKGG